MKSRETIFFVSDAHLGTHVPGFDSREEHLLEFLREIRRDARQLFILGDLFDFWVEYRHAIRPTYFRVLHELRNLIESGTEVTYLAGNHDFALGPFLREMVGIAIHPDHLDVTLQGRKTHMYHGDGILARDVAYRLLRRVLRNPLNQRLYRLIHPNLGVPLAALFSSASRHYMRNRGTDDSLGEYRARARGYLDMGSDLVVFGHTHHAELLDWDGKVYCNTGEWIRSYTYARLDSGVLSLWRYNPGGQPDAVQPSSVKQGRSAS